MAAIRAAMSGGTWASPGLARKAPARTAVASPAGKIVFEGLFIGASLPSMVLIVPGRWEGGHRVVLKLRGYRPPPQPPTRPCIGPRSADGSDRSEACMMGTWL